MIKPRKGISYLNPVNVEEKYMKRCAQYAIDHNVKHFELVGPTHSPLRGNCDGMTLYRKYAELNDEKDLPYIEYCTRVINETLDMIEPYGIKSYYWHHELEVPKKFDDLHPEILNERGDVEVTHPLIKDFLINKIEDFFHTYPKMTGIVLTLHETRIPLLKLKNQKLNKIERVKYVTGIVYETCKRLGKELIVRPFASIAQDYDDLMDAYEQISPDLMVCDKWTKYDWSLTRPHNPFLARIKNPLVIETDIYEYFGKGFLPLMLKRHIIEKVKYCNSFGVMGYVSRIDRGGFTPFDTPNEVNLEIMDAAVDGRDVDEAIDAFFKREYGEYWQTVREAMENTEELQIGAMHAEGPALHWLSCFPPLFSMKTAYRRFRDDFVVPQSMIDDGFGKVHYDVVIAEQDKACEEISKKLALVETLKGKLDEDKYYQLYMRFKNFDIVAKIFRQLTTVYHSIARYFEHHDETALTVIYDCIDKMRALDKEGFEALGADFHCERLSLKKGTPFRTFGLGSDSTDPRDSHVYLLDQLLKPALDMEVAKDRELRAMNPVDYIIPGGFSEEHNLKTEPNFSGALTLTDGPCRTAGSERGAMWSTVKGHGWFSYEMKVKPGVENTLVIEGTGHGGTLSLDVTIDGGEMAVYSKTGEGHLFIEHKFTPAEGKDKVTVRLDRNSEFLPFIYSMMIK